MGFTCSLNILFSFENEKAIRLDFSSTCMAALYFHMMAYRLPVNEDEWAAVQVEEKFLWQQVQNGISISKCDTSFESVQYMFSVH